MDIRWARVMFVQPLRLTACFHNLSLAPTSGLRAFWSLFFLLKFLAAMDLYLIRNLGILMYAKRIMPNGGECPLGY